MAKYNKLTFFKTIVIIFVFIIVIKLGVGFGKTKKNTKSDTSYLGVSQDMVELPNLEIEVLAVDSNIIRTISADGGKRMDVVPCRGIFKVNLSDAIRKENQDTIFVKLPTIKIETPEIKEAEADLVYYDVESHWKGDAREGVLETIRAQKDLQRDIKERFEEDLTLQKMAEEQAIMVVKNLLSSIQNKDVQVYF